MSISSEINRITNAVANAYTEADAKGAEMPSALTVANLANTIKSIAGNIGTFENIVTTNLATTIISGLTITDNGDNSYTLNGTATEARDLWLNDNFKIPSGTYKLVAMPSAHANDAVSLFDVTAWDWVAQDLGNGDTFTADGTHDYRLCVICRNDTTFNNFTVKPIITTNLNVTYDNWYPKIKSVENLFVPTRKDASGQGVTMTNNGDGTYTLNGTPSSAFAPDVGTITLAKGTYKLLGSPAFTSPTMGGISLRKASDGSGIGTYDIGNGYIFTLADDTTCNVRLVLQPAYGTANNLVYRPMITKNLSATNENFVSRVGGFNNLFVPTMSTNTAGGVTCTNNGDGTYTLNGTATGTVSFTLGTMSFTQGQYKVCGDFGGSASQHFIGVYKNGSIDVQVADAEGKVFNISAMDGVTIRYVAFSGTTFNNAIIKPMVTESLLPEYYDFVKGIEAGGKFAFGTVTTSTGTDLVIPHNLGKVPKWFYVMRNATSYANSTQAMIYNSEQMEKPLAVYYRGSIAYVNLDGTSGYMNENTIKLPHASSYNWYTNAVHYWACGE